MGLRIRKSKTIGPMRMTLSNSGVSYSIGGKGARYTVRADGQHQITTGIPGSGVYYVQTVGKNKRNASLSAHMAVTDKAFRYGRRNTQRADTSVEPGIDQVTASLESLQKEREQVGNGIITYLVILLCASPILLILAIIPGLNALMGIIGSIPFFIAGQKMGGLDDQIARLEQLLDQTQEWNEQHELGNQSPQFVPSTEGMKTETKFFQKKQAHKVKKTAVVPDEQDVKVTITEAEVAVQQAEKDHGTDNIIVAAKLEHLAALLKEDGTRLLDAANMEARATVIRAKYKFMEPSTAVNNATIRLNSSHEDRFARYWQAQKDAYIHSANDSTAIASEKDEHAVDNDHKETNDRRPIHMINATSPLGDEKQLEAQLIEIENALCQVEQNGGAYSNMYAAKLEQYAKLLREHNIRLRDASWMEQKAEVIRSREMMDSNNLAGTTTVAGNDTSQLSSNPSEPLTEEDYEYEISMGEVCYGEKDFELAKQHFQTAVEMSDVLFGAAHLNTGTAIRHLGKSMSQLECFFTARALFQTYLAILEQFDSSEISNIKEAIAEATYLLADNCVDCCYCEEGERLLKRVLPLYIKFYGPDGLETANVFSSLAGVLAETNPAESKRLGDHAIKILKAHGLWGRSIPDTYSSYDCDSTNYDE